MDNMKPSLTYSNELANTALELPTCPPRYVDIQILDNAVLDYAGFGTVSSASHQNGCKLPFACGPLTPARVVNNQRLTSEDAVKSYMEMMLEVATPFPYLPGDSFGVVCQNTKKDVDDIVRYRVIIFCRFFVNQFLEFCNQKE